MSPKYSKREDWGGFEISKTLYNWIYANLPKGKTILELGSGWGSGELAKRWDVWSVEHNEEWFQKYNQQSVFIPIKDEWYDPDLLKGFLDQKEYDLLLVDGPYPQSRRQFIQNFHLFDHTVPIVFDDTKRTEGSEIIEQVSRILGRPIIYHNLCEFGTIIGDPNGKAKT